MNEIKNIFSFRYFYSYYELSKTNLLYSILLFVSPLGEQLNIFRHCDISEVYFIDTNVFLQNNFLYVDAEKKAQKNDIKIFCLDSLIAL